MIGTWLLYSFFFILSFPLFLQKQKNEMGLFSWFSTTAESESFEGLDNGIPQKTQCYHIVSFLQKSSK